MVRKVRPSGRWVVALGSKYSGVFAAGVVAVVNACVWRTIALLTSQPHTNASGEQIKIVDTTVDIATTHENQL
jgi:hypothetical protein